MPEPIIGGEYSLADGAIANAIMRVAGHETWNTVELQRDFEVLGFQAGFVVVKRRSDGQVGSLEFSHSPRIYYSWKADS